MPTPQEISSARVKRFNSENVKKCFNIFKPQLEKSNYSPHRLSNVDEIGLTVDRHKHSTVVGLKGENKFKN